MRISNRYNIYKIIIYINIYNYILDIYILIIYKYFLRASAHTCGTLTRSAREIKLNFSAQKSLARSLVFALEALLTAFFRTFNNLRKIFDISKKILTFEILSKSY